MVEVPRADLVTTVLQRCQAVLSVAKYLFSAQIKNQRAFSEKIIFKNTVDRGETLKCDEIFEAAFLLFSIKECDRWQGCQPPRLYIFRIDREGMTNDV